MVEWHNVEEIMEGYDGKYCLDGTIKLPKKIKVRKTNAQLGRLLYGEMATVIEIHPNGKRISDGAEDLLILCKFFANELLYNGKLAKNMVDLDDLRKIKVAFDIIGKSPREVKEKKERKCNAILF